MGLGKGAVRVYVLRCGWSTLCIVILSWWRVWDVRCGVYGLICGMMFVMYVEQDCIPRTRDLGHG